MRDLNENAKGSFSLLHSTLLEDGAARGSAEEEGGWLEGLSGEEQLTLLYADAETTLPALHALGEAVCARLPAGHGVRPRYAPLKGLARAAVKSLDKYAGDFTRLTDLCRMTFECATLGAVQTFQTICLCGNVHTVRDGALEIRAMRSVGLDF